MKGIVLQTSGQKIRTGGSHNAIRILAENCSCTHPGQDTLVLLQRHIAVLASEGYKYIYCIETAVVMEYGCELAAPTRFEPMIVKSPPGPILNCEISSLP